MKYRQQIHNMFTPIHIYIDFLFMSVNSNELVKADNNARSKYVLDWVEFSA